MTAPVDFPFRYRVFGLELSTDVELPARPSERPQRDAPEVVLHADPAKLGRIGSTLLARRTDAAAAEATDAPAANAFIAERLDDGSIWLSWPRHHEFLVAPDGRQVLYRRCDGAADRRVSELVGQALSFVLLARGREPIHASVVGLGRSALALLGASGQGKSTLAAALMARGGRLVTDDLMVVRSIGEALCCEPGLRRIKLFEQDAERLLGGRAAGAPHGSWVDKKIVELDERETASAPAPLAAVVLLTPPGRGSSTTRLERLAPGEAVKSLVANTYNPLVIDDARLRTQFETVVAIARDLPVFRLFHRREHGLLDRVCLELFDVMSEIHTGPRAAP